MTARIDMTGQRFGRWTVLFHSGGRKWQCRCDCGTEKAVDAGSLRSGTSSGCTCCRENKGNRSHGQARSRIYNIWCGIKRRCLNEKDSAFGRYGGRGITICDEWKADFETFAAWANDNGYADHLTIDRRDNDRGYEPGNCRWSTYAEQNRNYSRNRPVEHDGRTALIVDFAAEHGIPAEIVQNRVRRYGWTMAEALKTPVLTREKCEPWRNHGMSKSSYYRAKADGRI